MLMFYYFSELTYVGIHIQNDMFFFFSAFTVSQVLIQYMY